MYQLYEGVWSIWLNPFVVVGGCFAKIFQAKSFVQSVCFALPVYLFFRLDMDRVFLLLLILRSLPVISFSNTITGKVAFVAGGDTITILTNQKNKSESDSTVQHAAPHRAFYCLVLLMPTKDSSLLHNQFSGVYRFSFCLLN